MSLLSLDNLTVLGSTPEEILRIAEEIGLTAISPIALPSARVNLDILPLHRGTEQAERLGKALKTSAVSIHNMDGFTIREAIDWEIYWDTLALSAELGSKNVVTLQFDPDPARGLDLFCTLCERSNSLGMGVMLEFMPLSRVRTIREAQSFLESAGQPNAGIMVDFFHLVQSGGTAAEVRDIPAGMIWGMQVCDGPLGMAIEDYSRRAVNDRLLPGDGEFPIADILAAMPDHASVGIEIPLSKAGKWIAAPLGRARQATEAVRHQLKLASNLMNNDS